MKKIIKVGIIGTGFGANVHAPLFGLHPNYEVVAISSVYRGNTEEVSKKTGLKNVYSDWRKMLENEEIDLVSIASNPSLHHEMVIEAFEMGFNVLCEKPMSLNQHQAAEMIQARDRAGKIGVINFEFRNYPARLKVKEIMESGVLGRILHINYRGNSKGYLSATTKKRNWLGDQEAGGGMLGALGSHMFDSLLWWSEKKVEEVSGKLSVHFPYWEDKVSGEQEVRTADDAFHVVGTLSGGTTFTTELIYPTRQSHNAWLLEVFGTEGSLIMMDDQKVMLGIGDEDLKEVDIIKPLAPPSSLGSIPARYYPVFMPMLDHLYQNLTLPNSSQIVLSSFEDGRNVQQVLDAVRESDALGKKIYLDDSN